MSPNPEKMRGILGRKKSGSEPRAGGKKDGEGREGRVQGLVEPVWEGRGGMRTGTCSLVLEIGGEEQSPFFPGCQQRLEQVGSLMGSEGVGAVGGDSVPKMLGHEREGRAGAKGSHLCVV